MIVCQNCHANNRPGARFCSSCGASLPHSSPATTPLGSQTRPLAVEEQSIVRPTPEPANIPAPVRRSHTDTRPLNARPPFAPRPPGAIFGDHYLLDKLVFSNDRQHRYTVTQYGMPAQTRFRSCPDPACGAIHAPSENASEQFCTACGTPFGEDRPVLILVESLAPVFEQSERIADLKLVHSNVRAPLAAFQEILGGTPRYCLVVPEVSPLGSRPEPAQVLTIGEELAGGLDYLHQNGLTFDGHIHESCLGLSGGRVVWAEFSACSAELGLSEAAAQADVRALAALLFGWLTGRNQYAPDPNLAPAINKFFELALSSPGFANGMEFAQGIHQAIQASATPEAVDFRLGRRTSVGMERTLNEDSLFTFETNRIQKSISQPLGVYVVADGMGGHAAGEIASGTIINAIAQKASTELVFQASLDRQRWLREAVEMANKAVYEMRKSTGTDMGSTLVMALIEGQEALVTHIGDSRAYLLNPQGIKQITVDHSLVERLIATNQITRAEARHHPQRNVIYRTVGDKGKIEVEISPLTLAPGDRLLLCSDGLSGMVDDQTIHKIVIDAPSAQSACDALIEAANAAGGEDNITAILVEVVQA